MRGYEWTKDKYVVVTDEDLESVPLKTVRAIEIEKFVDEEQAEETASRFVKQAYYLEPDEIGRKAFYLLKSVLADAHKTAICKLVLRDREQLAALNPFSDTMLLTDPALARRDSLPGGARICLSSPSRSSRPSARWPSSWSRHDRHLRPGRIPR